MTHPDAPMRAAIDQRGRALARASWQAVDGLPGLVSATVGGQVVVRHRSGDGPCAWLTRGDWDRYTAGDDDVTAILRQLQR